MRAREFIIFLPGRSYICVHDNAVLFNTITIADLCTNTFKYFPPRMIGKRILSISFLPCEWHRYSNLWAIRIFFSFLPIFFFHSFITNLIKPLKLFIQNFFLKDFSRKTCCCLQFWLITENFWEFFFCTFIAFTHIQIKLHSLSPSLQHDRLVFLLCNYSNWESFLCYTCFLFVLNFNGWLMAFVALFLING